MSKSHAEFYEELVKSIINAGHIKPEDFPNIDLYMDQVTTFMSSELEGTKSHPEDKILTKTMINNYAKDNLLPSPIKKKYSKDHMITLLFIYYLKNILSISDIQNILTPLNERFFASDNKTSDVTMDEIYKNIYRTVVEEIEDISNDVAKKIAISEQTFTDVNNNDEKDFLQYFSLICMLSYDIFAKKQILTALVDKLKDEENGRKAHEAEVKKAEAEAKKAEAKKTEPKKEKKQGKESR